MGRSLVDPSYHTIVTTLFAWLNQISGSSSNASENNAISISKDTPTSNSNSTASEIKNILSPTLQSDNQFKFIVRIENFHFFSTEVSRLSINSLLPFVKQAEEFFIQNRNEFINNLVNNKFKKLALFFDEIDQLLVTLPYDSIQFQQSHSKQNLLKVLTKKMQLKIRLKRNSKSCLN